MRQIKKKKLALAVVAMCVLAKSRRRRKSQSVWVRSWLARRQHLGFKATLITELSIEDSAEYRSMFRMDKATFEELLNMVRSHIEKKDTTFRECITAEERLQVTLRFLATGNTNYVYFISRFCCN